MDQPRKKPDLDFDYDSYGLERRLDAERVPDAAGYWFLAAVLFAFIAAGIIVYRPAMRGSDRGELFKPSGRAVRPDGVAAHRAALKMNYATVPPAR